IDRLMGGFCGFGTTLAKSARRRSNGYGRNCARCGFKKSVARKKRGDQLSESGLYVTSARSSAVIDVAWKIAIVLAWLVGLGFLALTVAHWGWQWFGPAPVTIPVTIPDSDVARRVADAKLFGLAPSATLVT